MIAILVFFFIQREDSYWNPGGGSLCFRNLPLRLFYWCPSSYNNILLVPVYSALVCSPIPQFVYKSLPHFQRSQPKSSTFIKLIGYCLNCFIIFCLSSGNPYSSQTAGSTTCPLTSISLPLSIMIYHLLNYQFFQNFSSDPFQLVL